MNGPRAVVAKSPVGRRRRPSGEPPPLPREVRRSTPWYLGVALGVAVFSVLLPVRVCFVAVTYIDGVVLRAVARLRFATLTTLLRTMDHIIWPWTIPVIVFGTMAVLVVYRRFRYLAVYAALVLAGLLGSLVASAWVGRMRPTEVRILTRWDGYAYPSRPVLGLALVCAGVLYTLVPASRRRTRAKLLAAGLIGAYGFARVYLAVDHPTDVVAAIILGWTVAVVAFRLVTPEEAFPISYRRGIRAHLDLNDRRRVAITKALDEQLALPVIDIEPFGLEGSSGSTPLRLTVRSGTGTTTLFAKLYALSHLRSDRWYKFTRTIVYGRLEDEKPFSTVRRLAEYEDHMLRLMRDASLPSPEPVGFAEITPEREYIIVMEFFEGASEIPSVVEISEIDDALAIVRRLWDTGIAHRDIKPSNLLLRDGKVFLIDVAFAAVRPTPWRQAVDLANMMLTLALSSSAEVVYERALLQFAPDDIAEAFAASRSVTIPTQLRARLRADGRDLLGQFRRLAPQRPPIAIQLWSLRRLALTSGVVVLTAIAMAFSLSYLQVAGLVASGTPAGAPSCDQTRQLAVVAQSVASSSYVPCIVELRAGWSAGDFQPRSGRTRFAIVSDRDTAHPVAVELARSCDISGATPTTPRADGVRTYLAVESIAPRYAGTLSDVFPGGCVTYEFDFARGPHIPLIDDFEHEVGLRSRRDLRLALHTDYRIDLGP
jgi:serine/threonine protein kinase